MLEPLVQIASALSTDVDSTERYPTLLAMVRRAIRCDSVVLLRLDGDAFVPMAVDGLRGEALARRYRPDDHPRLARIVATRGPVRFDDPGMPDPFDGLFVNAGMSCPHSCMGCAVVVEGRVAGALVFDALEPHVFDQIDLDQVAMIATMFGVAIRTSALASALNELASVAPRRADQAHRETSRRQLVGTSDSIAKVRTEIELLGRSELSALITGETGVGKELVAHAIHDRSARADRPMVIVNCAALPDALAESELFGHLRGAFTGAVEHRAGKFEVADGGTLFLDEVGELPLAIQSKLLRALQHGEVQRIGADRLLRVDVRVIAATNRDLVEEVRAGRFRADLLYRLDMFRVHVPPLRERPEDVAVLTGHFLDVARERLGVDRLRVTVAARKALREHAWPGNVRELEHTLMRGALRASQRHRGSLIWIDAPDLGLEPPVPATRVAAGAAAPRLRDAVDGFTKELISAAVRECDGNWAAAARRLGLQRGNLHRLAARLRMHERS